MHKTVGETVDFIDELALTLTNPTAEVLLAVPFTAIHAACSMAVDTPIVIGAQNMSEHIAGAFTGEISVEMLKEAGASFVLLGHSERRSLFGETSTLISKKLKLAVEQELPVILCVGESEEERSQGESEAILKSQLDESIGALDLKQVNSLTIAYEPVWAIGTGKTATPELAQQTHAFIRSYFAQKVDSSFADRLRILYGGSVKPTNLDALLEQPDIDGALVGGASLDLESFKKMVQK